MNINEIAKLAGVSRATVSRYLNDGYVSEEKKERIRKVIEQTGYKPSAQAQMLRTRKTGQVGVIIPKINSESISRMVAGISTVLKEAGFQLLLADTENKEKEELEYLRLFSENQVDGIILIATIFTPEHKKALKGLCVPIVILGQQLAGYSCVYQDDYHAARAAAEMLAGSGAEKIGCIGVTKRDRAVGEARKKGFLDAMEEAGIEWKEAYYEECGFSAQDGYEAAERLFAREPELDGVFCATDTIALGAMARIRETGRSVPEQVSVAGVGDTASGRLVIPRLSSVHFYYKTSGQEAARLLLELMNGTVPGKEVKMTYSVVERDTTRRQKENFRKS